MTVNQAIPTLTVNDPGGTYDGSLFAAMALVSGVVSGVDTTPALAGGRQPHAHLLCRRLR